jgi:putative component of membrane protein insertase Oxa1/YidC/SpoIIIJ protein YidD
VKFRFSPVLVVLIISASAWAQSPDLLTLQRIALEKGASSATNPKPRATSTLILPLRLFYGLYRHVISEQISANCAFDLSCSRFSVKAFGTFGFVKAGLLTTDRLTRCNAQVANELPPTLFNTKTGKIIDEPALY